MVVQPCRARYIADLGFIENYYFDFISIRRKSRLTGEKKILKKNIKHYGKKKKKKTLLKCGSVGESLAQKLVLELRSTQRLECEPNSQ